MCTYDCIIAKREEVLLKRTFCFFKTSNPNGFRKKTAFAVKNAKIRCAPCKGDKITAFINEKEILLWPVQTVPGTLPSPRSC